MKYLAVLATLFSLGALTSAQDGSSSTTPTAAAVPPIVSTTISYDTIYDDKDRSLDTVACSDGTNGLLTKGYTTFGSLPKYPFIGGAFAVEGWNSASCGTCWQLTYVVNGSNGGINTTVTRINVLAIDAAVDSFKVALGAMNELTGGRAEQLGSVPVTANQVDASVCGL